MKRSIIIFGIIVSATLQTKACDFCNCYLGLNPHYKKNTISLRYHLNDYTGTHLTAFDLASLKLTAGDFTEVRRRTEVYGQFYPRQKVQIVYSVPYMMNMESMSEKAMQAFSSSGEVSNHHHGTTSETTSTQESKETVSGIGDPVLLINYQLFNKLSKKEKGIAQRMFAGAGLVVPLGNYKTEISDPLERSHLPGSGSWRWMLSSTYLLKLSKWGMNTNFSYLFASTNSQNFSLGSTLNMNSIFYYQIHRKKFDFFPSTGIYFENAERSVYKGKELTSTGGIITYLHTGIDIYYKRFSFNNGLQIPIYQHLNENQPQLNYRFITSVAFAFGGEK